MGLSTANILATIPRTACNLLATVQQSLSQVATVRVGSETQEGSRLGEIAAQFATTNVSASLTPGVAYTGLFGQAGTFMGDVEIVLGALKSELGLKQLRQLDSPSLRQLGYFFYELSLPMQPPGETDDGLALDVFRRVRRLNEHGDVIGASSRCFELALELERK